MQEGEYIDSDGPARLHFTYGDDEPLRGKAVYFIRTSDKPMDMDKVRRSVGRQATLSPLLGRL